MKKIIYILCFSNLMAACFSDRSVSATDLIAAKDLDGLKALKDEKTNQHRHFGFGSLGKITACLCYRTTARKF
jgi:hypothetical protein